ncbi:MAG TPA: DUF1800 domain-containing protein [Paracoccus sp. (in: a-proteobacteria)]|nr:DUF1800 domain-containing protein [Paracoccus sp. (in: a-proteobacteria)]
MTLTPDFPELAAIRLGYGLSPLAPPPADAAEVLASCVRAAIPDDPWTAALAGDAQISLSEARKAREEMTIPDDEFRAVTQKLNAERLAVLQRRVARAVAAPAGFGERLVQFWADHFTTVAQNPPQHLMAAAFVNEAIRPNLAGRFADLLFAAETHPMMLVYLNQNASFGPNSLFVRRRPERNLGLNENLAREIMELHTLGVGADYTQADVRELAELLTGLTWNPREGQHFRPQVAEPGAETVLGRRYSGKGTSGLDEIRRAMVDLARHPATAQHVARKLAVHFAADDPPPDLVRALAAVWQDTEGDLAQVYAVLATHPALAATFRHKARQPFDFLVASLRALGLDRAQVMAFDGPRINQSLWIPLAQMGQPFGRARGPDGWAEAADAWITPQMLSARIAWALQQPQRLTNDLPDPRAFLSEALGGTASERLIWAVPKAESAREGVAIVLASTDFNRR